MPRVYGWQHIVFIVFFLAVSAAALTVIKLKVKKESTINIIVKCMGGLLLALIIWNRISIAFRDGKAIMLIPDSFCGTTSLIFAIISIFCKRDSLPFHYAVYAGFWGGLIVTLYPDFLGQNPSFMYSATISGLWHHAMSMFLAVLLVMTGYVKLSLKKFYAFPIGFALIMVYGLFLIDAIPGIDNAMYIHKPLVAGTFLTWYVVGPALIAVSLAIVLIYEYICKKRTSRLPNETE